jgi:hypothetical protein
MQSSLTTKFLFLVSPESPSVPKLLGKIKETWCRYSSPISELSLTIAGLYEE